MDHYIVTLSDGAIIDFHGSYVFSGSYVIFFKEQDDGSTVMETQSLGWVKQIVKLNEDQE